MTTSQQKFWAGSPAKAALLMLTAMLAFSLMTVFVRLAASQIHSFEIAFFRNFLAVLMFLPLIARKGPEILRSKQPKLHLVRAAALGFASPFFATLGAVLFFDVSDFSFA